jgi:hypothetical protein
MKIERLRLEISINAPDRLVEFSAKGMGAVTQMGPAGRTRFELNGIDSVQPGADGSIRVHFSVGGESARPWKIDDMQVELQGQILEE